MREIIKHNWLRSAPGLLHRARETQPTYYTSCRYPYCWCNKREKHTYNPTNWFFVQDGLRPQNNNNNNNTLVSMHAGSGEIPLVARKRLLFCVGYTFGKRNLAMSDLNRNNSSDSIKRWLFLFFPSLLKSAYNNVLRQNCDSIESIV